MKSNMSKLENKINKSLEETSTKIEETNITIIKMQNSMENDINTIDN
jgi:5-bromo-4-chloroindolyl phosphate hydrolysis protein